MSEVRRYIKENWPDKIIRIDPDWEYLQYFGEINRNFLLDVGLPIGAEIIMSDLSYTFCSLITEKIRLIEEKWRYIAIFGQEYEFGCMIGDDKIYFFEGEYYGFMNSNLENAYYFIIKAYESMLSDSDYTWLDFRCEYNHLEYSRSSNYHREFWESIIAFQLGEDEMYIE